MSLCKHRPKSKHPAKKYGSRMRNHVGMGSIYDRVYTQTLAEYAKDSPVALLNTIRTVLWEMGRFRRLNRLQAKCDALTELSQQEA